MFLAPIKPVLAAVLSLALALPATTTPARAELSGQEAARILGGLAALYVLKEAIDKRNERRTERQQAHQPQRQTTHRHADGTRHRHDGPVSHRHDHRSDPGHHQSRRANRILPERCFRSFETRQGRVRGYGARCLRNSVAQPRALPSQCIRQVQTHRGWRNLYRPRCLRRAGWTRQYARH